MLKSKGVRNGFILGLASFLATSAAVAQGNEGAGEPLGERESYAFVRTIEGQATVAADGQGIGNALEQNQPLLSGDRLRTDGASRLEIFLPDRNRLILDRDSVVTLDRMAYSGDQESRVTVLVLNEGEVLLEVTEEALGDELPRIETGSATIYVHEPGTYRVRYERDGWLELVSRSGYAEMVTDRGSTVVRAGESAQAGSDRWGRTAVEQAGGIDDLERWSDDLVRAAQSNGRSSRYLDGQHQYASSQLDNNGDWVVHANNYYWRPRVAAGWSPYYDGRWGWTPSGYTWISYEPWGWVPYHYGNWSMLPGYGWAWYPGTVYSPAWVYWHWSGGYAGWCPTGYYTNYYNPWYRGGFRWGLYGWAGGNWGYYSHWNFAPVHCFRDRNFRGQLRHGDDLRQERGWPEVPRGLITTDTRDFRPDRIDRADQLIHAIGTSEKGRLNRDLPDVTDFVGRKRDLAPPIARAITPDNDRSPKIRFNEPKVVSSPGWKDRDRAGRTGVSIDTGKVAGRDRSPQGDDASGRGTAVGRDTKGWRGDSPVDTGKVATGGRSPKVDDSGGRGTAASRDTKDWRGNSPIDGGKVASGDRSPNADDSGGRGSAVSRDTKDWRGDTPVVSGGGDKSGGSRLSQTPKPRTDSSGRGGSLSTTISDNRQGWKDTAGRGNGGASASSGSPRTGLPKATTPTDRSGAAGGTRSPGSSAKPDDRSRSSAPVERVISGTRKPAPKSDDSASSAKGRDPYQAFRKPSYDTSVPSVSSSRGNGNGSVKSEPYGGGSSRYDSSADAGRKSYREPAPSQSIRSAPRQDAGRGNAASGGPAYRTSPPSGSSSYRSSPPSGSSDYRSSPPSGSSSYRAAPPSGGSAYRSAPPSGGSAYRSAPQTSGSGGRSAPSTGSSARGSSPPSSGGKSTGSQSSGGGRSSGSSSNSSGSGSNGGSGRSSNGSKHDR